MSDGKFDAQYHSRMVETTLDLLDVVESGGVHSQRRLSVCLGVALGLTNAVLRRCIRKGQLKIKEDRDRVEREIAEMRFDFEKQRKDLQNSFLSKEAGVYSTCYKDLIDLLGWYCKQQNILIVLRDRDSGETGNPQAVLQTLNKQVVFCHRNLDLTTVMIDGLNRK